MNNQFCQLTTRVWELASVQMNKKPHISEYKKQDCFLQKEARVCVSNAFVLEESMFK